MRPTSIAEPVRITGSAGPWDGIRDLLDRNGVAVVFARLADWRPDRAGATRLRQLLGSDWRRYLALGNADVRLRFAASRALLKFAAAAALGVVPEEIEIGYSPSGRPELRGFDGLDISLSHTADLLVIGATTAGVIGVDAERTDRTLWSSGVSKNFCTPREHELVAALPQADRDPFLLRLWTLKEAYSKAIGQGMMFPFTEFGFEGAQVAPGEQRVRVVGPDGSLGTGREWRFATHVVDEQFLVSVAIGGEHGFHTADTMAATALDAQVLDAFLHAMESSEPEPIASGWDAGW